MVEKLKRQINEALARVDQMSAGLVKMQSLRDVQLLPYSYHSPCQSASLRPSGQPPQFQLGMRLWRTPLDQQGHQISHITLTIQDTIGQSRALLQAPIVPSH